MGQLDAEPYVFSPGGFDGGDFHARFFAPNHDVIEDPATGSAHAAFSLYLMHMGLIDQTAKTQIIVEQGYEMGRPCKLYNQIVTKDAQLINVTTGGRCHQIAKGMISI